MKKLATTLMGILSTLGFVLLVSVIYALPFMWLWNWLMPAIFGLCRISVWKALGLTILSNLIFRHTDKKP